MKTAILAATLFVVMGVGPASAQSPASTDALPDVVSFVAPAYPRAAREARVVSTSIARVTLATDGRVSAVLMVSGHPMFEKYVADAVKRWRFKSSGKDHVFDITFRFELHDDENCDKSPETQVSGELPTLLVIRTGYQCINVVVH